MTRREVLHGVGEMPQWEKMLVMHVWQLEFMSGVHSRRRELTRQRYPLTSTHASWHRFVHPHPTPPQSLEINTCFTSVSVHHRCSLLSKFFLSTVYWIYRQELGRAWDGATLSLLPSLHSFDVPVHLPICFLSLLMSTFPALVTNVNGIFWTVFPGSWQYRECSSAIGLVWDNTAWASYLIQLLGYITGFLCK